MSFVYLCLREVWLAANLSADSCTLLGHLPHASALDCVGGAVAWGRGGQGFLSGFFFLLPLHTPTCHFVCRRQRLPVALCAELTGTHLLCNSVLYGAQQWADHSRGVGLQGDVCRGCLCLRSMHACLLPGVPQRGKPFPGTDAARSLPLERPELGPPIVLGRQTRWALDACGCPCLGYCIVSLHGVTG